MPDPRPLPPFYNDLEASLAEGWRLMTRAVADRRSPLHTPAVASVTPEGLPSVRTVVLRAADPAHRLLRFHTDVRAAKITHFKARPDVAALFYDPGAKIQMRVGGRASVHHGDDVARAAWEVSRDMSRACYRTTPAPGTPLDEGGGFILPPDDGSGLLGFDAFCAVLIHVTSLEWLYLAGRGHRRAHFSWDEKGRVSATWLVP